ncbi:MAG: DUF3800 domain-containing protein [Candidatus Zixiibacteriota bacterium]
MRLAYYDEAGDDGYPTFSSNYFVLTALYLHYLHWEETLDQLLSFRKQLRSQYGLPLKVDFHTTHFLKKKKPFTGYGLSNQDRLDIISAYCDIISSLKVKIINVCIVKKKIIKSDYQILDKALTFSIQRIHNDLKPKDNPESKFMIITDEGRHGKMRKTSRRMRRINYVPSRFGGAPQPIDIKTLIEDPLPKNSEQSYFVQSADLVSLIIYLYACYSQGTANVIASRISGYVKRSNVLDWMDRLKPSLNTFASRTDPYGVYFHPS